jgi:hypothetical protein
MKLSPALVKAMSVMAEGYGLYASGVRGWLLTDGTKVAGATAHVLFSRGWIGNPSLGFYRLTDEGRAVLIEQTVSTETPQVKS